MAEAAGMGGLRAGLCSVEDDKKMYMHNLASPTHGASSISLGIQVIA